MGKITDRLLGVTRQLLNGSYNSILSMKGAKVSVLPRSPAPMLGEAISLAPHNHTIFFAYLGVKRESKVMC